ncbi:hypothetical protein PInf_021477 [Phytophthora infestans]|nr:hypothetical protein PInf_021477 [Phytophthora infestans]
MSSRLTAKEKARMRAFLEEAFDRDEHGTPGEDTKTLKQQFWAEMRSHLGGNGLSTGLLSLDQLAEDVIDGKAGASLSGTVVVVPTPAGTSFPVTAPAVSSAASTAKPLSGKKSASSSKKPPTNSSEKSSAKKPSKKSLEKKSSAKSSKRKASSDSSEVKPPPKKRRSSDKGKKAFPLPSSEYGKLVEANAEAPVVVLKAIAAVLVKAEAAGKKPWCLAFPWTGRPFWYDPREFRHYRAHWRFWMAHRRAFWKWAFHAPLESGQPVNLRRKRKLCAVRARLAFTSFCIETWGIYAFLEKLEQQPEMFWLGGQPGRSNCEGSTYVGHRAESLTYLESHDHDRYQATEESALAPAKIDAYGYDNLRFILEMTDALNPTADEPNRLSLKALARVRWDLMSNMKSKASWSGARTEEPWKSLVINLEIKKLQDKLTPTIADGSYELPTPRLPSNKECSREDWSDFEEEPDEEEEKAAVPGDDEDEVQAAEEDDEAADSGGDDGEAEAEDEEEEGSDEEDEADDKSAHK